MLDEIELVRDKSVVAAIGFRDTTIYPTDAIPGQAPQRIVAPDPRGRFHKVYHRAGNPEGTYEADSPEYWREVTEALSPAGAILLLGHGKGRANASHHWVAYVEQHRKDVAGVTAGPILLRWSAAARLRGQSLGRTTRRGTVSSRGFLASTDRSVGRPQINVVQTLLRSHPRAEYAPTTTAARGSSVPRLVGMPGSMCNTSQPPPGGSPVATRSLLEPAGASTRYQHGSCF
jgi:hypothetical protein